MTDVKALLVLGASAGEGGTSFGVASCSFVGSFSNSFSVSASLNFCY